MKIDLTKQPHQDNLKVDFYHRFKILAGQVNSDLELLCEYRVPKCRFDMIVYNSGHDIVAIIEFRRFNARTKPAIYGNKHRRYSQFGVPIHYVATFDDASDLIYNLLSPF